MNACAMRVPVAIATQDVLRDGPHAGTVKGAPGKRAPLD